MATLKKNPELGYGGVDYNNSELAMKKQIAQNQAKIANNSAFKQDETQRALQVIAQREAKGLDTSSQQKYLTTNLGYKPPDTSKVLPTSTPSPTPNATQSTPKPNQQGSDLMEMMRKIATRESTPFSYDPNSDPAYQAALKRAGANIEQGNSAAQAEMNRRGILNSTITSDRMSEIAANEMGRVETDVLPNLMQQAYQQYLDQENMKNQQLANIGNVAQMYIGEDQRGIDNQFATSDRTGYIPAGEQAQELVSQLMSLKEQAETKGITATERTKLSNQADGIRAMLSNMGVDASKFGANVNYNTASQITPTIRTIQGQQLDLSKQGQAFEQQFTKEQFSYQQARDAISDQRWKMEFDEAVRQNGLSYGLNVLKEGNQVAYQQAQLALAQDDNDRQWVSLEQSQGEYNGMTPTQVIDAARQRFTVTEKSGKSYIPNDAGTKEEIYNYVASMGLPLGQDDQVMLSLGLSSKEIQSFDKKYGVDISGKQ